jgi:hypothetical protein
MRPQFLEVWTLIVTILKVLKLHIPQYSKHITQAATSRETMVS